MKPPLRINEEALRSLTETFNPSDYIPKVGKHTAEFAAELAASSPSGDAPPHVPTIDELRAAVSTSLAGKELPYPKDLSAHSYAEKTVGGLRCYVLSAEKSGNVPTLIMFYGGGFCLNTLSSHKSFMANIASIMPCNIILPDYPLAPEAKAPEVIARTQAFLQECLTNPTAVGVSENVILMGWSSGGNMALTLAMNLEDEAPSLFHKISRLILLSPWIDLSLQVSRKGPFQLQQNADKIAAGADLLEIMGKCYLPAGCIGTEPEYCPAYRDEETLRALPPVTIIVGGCEVLFGDSVFITDALQRAGAKVQLIALEGQTHNYMVFHKLNLDGVFVPGLIADVALDRAIDDVRGHDGLGIITKVFNMDIARSTLAYGRA
jgi:acetyl esterase/lipase